MAKDTGTVNIHGKEYTTVAKRVQDFRSSETTEKFTIETELVERTADDVVMKAIIKNEEGRVIATGYAEEKRSASMINKTSALENCETSAIGRALAAFGLAGTEYASADEVANAIKNQNRPAVDTTTSGGDQEILALAKSDLFKEMVKQNYVEPSDQKAFIKFTIGKETIDNIDDAHSVAEALETDKTDDSMADAVSNKFGQPKDE
jgi:hypothetical protein